MPDDREDGVVQGSAGRRCALQFPANECAEILQGTDLRFRGLAAGARIHDGKRPDRETVSSDHGCPRVEANWGGTATSARSANLWSEVASGITRASAQPI